MGAVREGMASASSPLWTTRSPTTLTGSLVCERAWAGSPGLPSPAFSRLTFSQTGRVAASSGAAANGTRERSCDAH